MDFSALFLRKNQQRNQNMNAGSLNRIEALLEVTSEVTVGEDFEWRNPADLISNGIRSNSRNIANLICGRKYILEVSPGSYEL